METQSTNKELRSFGLLVGGIFAVIGFWPMLLRGDDVRAWALVLAALLIGPAAVFPAILRPVHKVWMKLGHILGWINTRIILGAIFFGVVTPMGLIRRLFRKDSMGRRTQTDVDSYRLPRSARPASHMTKQY
jgi:hypothetical protein